MLVLGDLLATVLSMDIIRIFLVIAAFTAIVMSLVVGLVTLFTRPVTDNGKSNRDINK